MMTLLTLRMGVGGRGGREGSLSQTADMLILKVRLGKVQI